MMFVQSQDERMLGYTGVRGIAWFDDTVSHRQITPLNRNFVQHRRLHDNETPVFISEGITFPYMYN